MKLHPFVKWVGGKTQLLPEIVERIPDDTDIFIEPFLGGGAVFLDVLLSKPNIKLFLINDINKELMNVYGNVASMLSELLYKELRKLEYAFNNAEDKKTFYYNERDKYNDVMLKRIPEPDGAKEKLMSRIAQNARFMFLNKTCFNGLYRVNAKGEFNAAFNNSETVSFDYENLKNIREAFENKIIYMSSDDYKNICCCSVIDRHIEAQPDKYKKVFVYLDPPYKPMTSKNGEFGYTADKFSDQQQLELKEMCDKINEKGYLFLQSNSDSENNFFGNLYSDYNITTVKAQRKINCDGTKRGKINEILISNFIPNKKYYELF